MIKTRVKEKLTSENIVLCAMQIFMYNMISVVVIIAGSLIAQKKEGEKYYKTYGQLLITAAFATKYLLLAEGKKATTRKIRDIKMKKSEVLC